jgi:hypothetical protein
MSRIEAAIEDANTRLVTAAENALKAYADAMVEEGLDAPEIKRRLRIYTEDLKEWYRQSMGEVYLTVGLAVTKPKSPSVN